ncbi:MAG: maleylpyruvate isomerase family mycothiol-dependent enzyme [Pseudonocardiales bacterium]|nr:MAG: maleylpyruvate isomerase family mycothiol-dependent enzyme [Pseudonocardiales bacterium]
METDRFLDLLRADGELLATAALRGLDAEVPPCPGWRVRDAVEHTAAVYEHKLLCISERAAPDPWPPDWPNDRDPVAWFIDARGRLLDVLSSNDATTPAFTWWPPDQTVGFWIRRMAQETAVHRVDVQSAFDAVTPVDAELAADGVDEVLMLMLSGDWSEEPFERVGDGERIQVSTGGRAWLVTLQAKEVTVEETSGEADATIGGASSDVLLWLWGRAPDSAVALSGDPAVIRLFRERLAYATD